VYGLLFRIRGQRFFLANDRQVPLCFSLALQSGTSLSDNGSLESTVSDGAVTVGH